MKHRVLTLSLVLILFICTGSLIGKPDVNEIHRSQGITTEKSLHISVEYGIGEFFLKPGSVNNTYTVDISYNSDRLNPRVEYEIRDGVGYLEVRSDDDGEDHSITWKKDMESTCTLTFHPNLPTEMDLDIGLGKGTMEFGGTQLTELELSNGLSETELDFSRLNTSELRHMDFETGLGKFRAKNLSNARFHELSLEVGLGSAMLDFHGNGLERCTANISVGLGSVTLIVPENLGVRVNVNDSFLSRVSFDSDFRKHNDSYYTSNWNEAKKRIIIDMEIGLGSATIERIQ